MEENAVDKAEYVPKSYWEARLSANSNLRGVGHISFSKDYNEWLYRAKRRTLEASLAGVAIDGKSVLDVGSGTGFFVEWYSKRGAVVAGVDITEHSIESLRKRFPGDFRVQDISEPGAHPQRTYDLVNVWDVLYHVVDDDAHARAIQYVASAVRVRGLLLLTDVLGAAQNRRVAAHVRFRSLDTYKSLLEPLGFEFRRVHFLYRWLNRRVTIESLDSRLARLYFWLDNRERAIPSNNVSLGVWERTMDVT